MKRRITIIAAAAVCATLLFLIGIWILPGVTDAKPSAKRLSVMEDAAQVYQNAVSQIASKEVIGLTVSETRQAVVGSNVFTEKSDRNISVSGYGTDAMRAQIDETLSFGSQSTRISEVFTDGIAYVSIDDNHFSSGISAAEYAKRLVPEILIDAGLYSAISGYESDTMRLVIFEQPSAPEAWATEEGAEFLGAKAVACISPEGTLLQWLYSVTFTKNDTVIHLSVSSEPADATDITVPENTAAYTSIGYLDGPRMLEQASGYLIQAGNLNSTYSEKIFCQAFGDTRTKNVALQTGLDGGWAAQVDTEVITTNTGHVGEVSRHTHNEVFQSGKYTLTVDDGTPEENPEIDQAAMQTYCRNLLVGTIMLPGYITSADASQVDNILRITYSASGEFADLISTNCCQTLYENPELLNQLAQKHTVDSMQCYLDIDANTGLVCAAGILYSGTYTIDGLPYQLQFQADQTFNQ